MVSSCPLHFGKLLCDHQNYRVTICDEFESEIELVTRRLQHMVMRHWYSVHLSICNAAMMMFGTVAGMTPVIQPVIQQLAIQVSRHHRYIWLQNL
jgi:hypothetical protein